MKSRNRKSLKDDIGHKVGKGKHPHTFNKKIDVRNKLLGGIKKRRGRKSKYEKVFGNEGMETEVKRYRVMGYCAKCYCVVGNSDIKVIKGSKKYICAKCGKVGSIKGLKKERFTEEKPKTKREYLQDTIQLNNDNISYIQESPKIIEEIETEPTEPTENIDNLDEDIIDGKDEENNE